MGDKLWENLLNPKILRSSLIFASIYIAAFEVLKNAIVDRIRNFYSPGFDENASPIDPKYQAEVLAKNKSPVYASLEWLRESRVINDNDMDTFERVRGLRNKLAHSITEMLIEELSSDLPARFQEMIALLDKIERWWSL